VIFCGSPRYSTCVACASKHVNSRARCYRFPHPGLWA
jgi:hypothetical protein